MVPPCLDQGILGWFGLEGTSKPCCGRDTSSIPGCSWTLPGIQGHPVPGPPHPPRQQFHPNLPPIPALWQWEAIPCVLSLQPLSLSSSPGSPARGSELSLEPFPFRAEHSQLSQPGCSPGNICTASSRILLQLSVCSRRFWAFPALPAWLQPWEHLHGLQQDPAAALCTFQAFLGIPSSPGLAAALGTSPWPPAGSCCSSPCVPGISGHSQLSQPGCSPGDISMASSRILLQLSLHVPGGSGHSQLSQPGCSPGNISMASSRILLQLSVCSRHFWAFPALPAWLQPWEHLHSLQQDPAAALSAFQAFLGIPSSPSLAPALGTSPWPPAGSCCSSLCVPGISGHSQLSQPGCSPGNTSMASSRILLQLSLRSRHFWATWDSPARAAPGP
ncbi:uncharacterized protein LOC131378699 [Hirundo rustica]|uniref:uncharacterized protein LOC131378699 n=1 Tax=Hirundo rustica TaxID=43150 RepID=UPI00267281B1|nr:uncharacterized protein LOC131378699 [Hirundo rustica]